MNNQCRPKRRAIARYGFLHAPEGRLLRGRRICEALTILGGVDLAHAAVLDIGCSTGLITETIARKTALTVGIDVDTDAVAYAAKNSARARFAVASGGLLPFMDESFDAVVCNHVYEHVPNAMALMHEVKRVLRRHGACYFAAGHSLQVIEPHYRLPLLSCMPRAMASALLRLTGRATLYEERFLPPWRLGQLFDGFSDVNFVSARMLLAPERFGFPDVLRLLAIAGPLAPGLSYTAARLAPTWIYVLRK